MSYGVEYPSAQLGSSTPKFLCTPSLLAGRAVWETEKPLTLHKHCSAMPKTSICYHRCYHQKSKAQTTQDAMKKTNAIPAKTSTFSEDKSKRTRYKVCSLLSSNLLDRKLLTLDIASRERVHRLQHSIFSLLGVDFLFSRTWTIHLLLWLPPSCQSPQ